MPGQRFPERLTVTGDLAAALQGAALVVEVLAGHPAALAWAENPDSRTVNNATTHVPDKDLCAGFCPDTDMKHPAIRMNGA